MTTKTRPTALRRKRLNPSRQARPSQPPDRLAILDAIEDRLKRVRTLAGLLSACAEPQALETRLAAEAGQFMEEELLEVKALLSQAWREAR